MPPRKSVSKSSKSSQATASSSKITLDALPPADVPESLTPGFVPNQRAKVPLVQEEREAYIHEVRQLDACHDALLICCSS
jgi:kinetochore protein Mis12/MTW1